MEAIKPRLAVSHCLSEAAARPRHALVFCSPLSRILDTRLFSVPPFPGSYSANLITEAERMDIVQHACPGAGACGEYPCYHAVKHLFVN
jgi:hypothetical protein